jgi:hypothetical protein
MLRPVEKVAQGIKKEGETFGFYPLVCFLCVTELHHTHRQERVIPNFRWKAGINHIR